MDQDLRVQMYRDKMKSIEDDITPFGFVVDGTENEYYIDNSGQHWEYVSPNDNTVNY